MGVEAVLGNGDRIDWMSGLLKDNTGYHLPSLLCGSEGTLGLVTAARLGLIEARYPDYAFLRAGNKLMHRFVVVAGTRREDGAVASRARSMRTPTSPDPEGERR